MNIQRKFGKLTVKSEGHEAKVQVLLNDFEQADQVLAKLIDATNAWREAWRSVLSVQLGVATTYEELYNPITGATEGHDNDPAMTPQQQLERSFKLKEAYAELRTDLLEEINLTDARIIKPAQEARNHIKPIRKVIKKHDDRRLDFERYQDRVIHAQKKQTMSEKDEASFARAKEELSRALDAFQVIDAHIRKTLPPIIAATFAILPHLLAVLIMTQHTLLAQYYTVLHTYCEEQGFPSPPPPMEEVVGQWNSDFKPIQDQVESITLIARGKVVHTPMQSGAESRQSSLTGLNLRGNIRSHLPSSQNSKQTNAGGPGSPDGNSFSNIKGNILSRLPSSQNTKQNNAGRPGSPDSNDYPPRSSGSIPSSAMSRHNEYEEEEAPPPRPPRPSSSRIASNGGSYQPRPRYDAGEEEEAPQPRPPRPNFSHTDSSGGSAHSRPRYDEREEEEAPPAKPPRPSFGRTISPGGPALGYAPRTSPYTNGGAPDSTGRLSSSTSTPRFAPSASLIAGKKKPPPPPPKPKRSQMFTYVTALYSFEGQAAGDLSFTEGDKIKIIKKTDSNDDWWEGELKGRKGNFPANYCEMAA